MTERASCLLSKYCLPRSGVLFLCIAPPHSLARGRNPPSNAGTVPYKVQWLGCGNAHFRCCASFLFAGRILSLLTLEAKNSVGTQHHSKVVFSGKTWCCDREWFFAAWLLPVLICECQRSDRRTRFWFSPRRNYRFNVPNSPLFDDALISASIQHFLILRVCGNDGNLPPPPPHFLRLDLLRKGKLSPESSVR